MKRATLKLLLAMVIIVVAPACTQYTCPTYSEVPDTEVEQKDTKKVEEDKI